MLLSAFSHNTRAETRHDYFVNSLLYANDIEDQAILRCLHKISLRALEKVRGYCEGESLYLEALMLVHWPPGKGIGDHVDNGTIEGEEDTATPWRDYSAVIYLNDDYDAGEIYFTGRLVGYQIKPETGMMVSFDSGPDFPHGVHPCENGDRYTLPLWFSEDPERSYSLEPFLTE